MKFQLKTNMLAKQETNCLMIPVFEEEGVAKVTSSLDQEYANQINKILNQGDLQGKIGQTLLLHQPPNITASRILLVGCGKRKSLNETKYQQIISSAVKAIKCTSCTDAVCTLTELDIPNRNIHWKVRESIISTANVLYTFDKLKKEKASECKLDEITFTCANNELQLGTTAIQEGQAIASGMTLCRDLGNMPGNICTPEQLAKETVTTFKHYRKLKTNILDMKAIQKLGMGGLYAVAKGSAEPCRLITIEYNGGEKTNQPIALIGKGITFDSGGISLKPSADMDEMKYDMCGAASVIGTMKALAELELPINVVAIVAAAENLPGGSANKPGDVITTMSGKTVEVLNTDAEGRLILCDAITYSERFNPCAIIDVATLTGAVVIALGNYPSGLFGNNEDLTAELKKAATQSYDRVWELPIWDDYQESLDSNFADIANISGGRSAGSITAACFLSRFTKETPWAHLDIAATAYKSGKNKGATGRPVPLLVQFLLNRVNTKN